MGRDHLWAGKPSRPKVAGHLAPFLCSSREPSETVRKVRRSCSVKTAVGQNTQPELDSLRDSQPVQLTEQWSCVIRPPRRKKISRVAAFRTDCSLLRRWPEITDQNRAAVVDLADHQRPDQSRGEHVVGIPVGPMGRVGIPWEWEMEAKLLGIKMGMGIKSSRVGGNENFVFIEIPAPSDLYQIYSNLQIEFAITVALVVYFFICF